MSSSATLPPRSSPGTVSSMVSISTSCLPSELIRSGLTNWTAAYATGLLVARRALTHLGLADKYEGVTEPTGEVQLTQARASSHAMSSSRPDVLQSARASPAHSSATSMSVSAVPPLATVSLAR